MTIIRDKFNNSKAFFNTHKTKNLKFRKQQLKLLSKNIKNHENELLDALYKDLVNAQRVKKLVENQTNGYTTLLIPYKELY